jgi:hypothetical protein
MSALATIGHNNPPEPTPFEQSSEEAEDLFLEASNWCDGAPVETQEQADALAGLRAQIRAAIKRADERRKEEALPYDEAKADIQTRYNTLIGDNKTSGKGKLILADEACQSALAPWLRRAEKEKLLLAEAARVEREAKQRAAEEAFQLARGGDDLATKAEAERLAREATAAEKQSRKAEKIANTRTGLRTVWSAEVVDLQAFAKWAWTHDHGALEDHFRVRAAALVRNGQTDIPGVAVTETREAR